VDALHVVLVFVAKRERAARCRQLASMAVPRSGTACDLSGWPSPAGHESAVDEAARR
jgi:hypothetical protein